MRRHSRVFLIVLLLALLLGASCGGAREDSAAVERFLLDTLCSITIPSRDPNFGRALADEAFVSVERIDALLNNQTPAGPVARLSARANTAAPLPVEIEDALWRMIQLAEETEGRFDPTVSPLVAAYGFYAPPGEAPVFRLPTESELQSARRRVGFRHLRIDWEAHTIRFDRSGMLLDLGAVGKGYALDSAVSVLRENGVGSALLDFGGNVAVIGTPPGGGMWRVGIQNPRGEGIVGVIPLKDAAAATSGDYQRYFIEDGVRYFHILDAVTGEPAWGCAAVLAIHPSALEADALSTAAFLMGPDRALSFIEARGGLGIVITEEDGRLTARASERLVWEPNETLNVIERTICD